WSCIGVSQTYLLPGRSTGFVKWATSVFADAQLVSCRPGQVPCQHRAGSELLGVVELMPRPSRSKSGLRGRDPPRVRRNRGPVRPAPLGPPMLPLDPILRADGPPWRVLPTDTALPGRG